MFVFLRLTPKQCRTQVTKMATLFHENGDMKIQTHQQGHKIPSKNTIQKVFKKQPFLAATNSVRWKDIQKQTSFCDTLKFFHFLYKNQNA